MSRRLGASNRNPATPWPGVTASQRPVDHTELDVDDLVEVRSRFDNRWTAGFAITAIRAEDCQIRRITDDTPLPVWFALEDVRPADAA